MFKDLFNFSFVFRISIALISVLVIKLLNIEFSSEVANKYLLIFSSSGVFAILSLGINDKIAFNEKNRGINKIFFLFYTFITLSCILISIIIDSVNLAIFSFVFIYPMITFDRIFQNSGKNILAYTIQASLTLSLLFFLLFNYGIKLPFYIFPSFTLLIIILTVLYYNKKYTSWNTSNPFALVKSNFLTENIQFTVLFGLDIILSSFYTNSNISNQFIILTRFYSLFQMIILVIPNNYYLVLNGTYDFDNFKKRYFTPIFTLLILFSTLVYFLSPYIFNFFLQKSDYSYSISTLIYIIVFTVTGLSSLMGSINTIFVKSNEKLFTTFVKLQYLLLIINIFNLALLFCQSINYIIFLLFKSLTIILFTTYITYKIKNEIRYNNT
jgi:hypothetical protein